MTVIPSEAERSEAQSRDLFFASPLDRTLTKQVPPLRFGRDDGNMRFAGVDLDIRIAYIMSQYDYT